MFKERISQHERTIATIDWVQDKAMRDAELDREYLELELRWLAAQESKQNKKRENGNR